ncbi:MAG: hypothetical protein EOL97_02345 [Spirochaetia bacterium]|nr:hypothetical protein [Spirochaetia bacterium]
MGAKSYVLDQLNNNIHKGLDTGLSAINLLVETEVKNNQDYFASQISEGLEFNVYDNPNTKEWDYLSSEVFNNAERKIDELNISDEAKYRIKTNVLDYSRSNYNATLQTRMEKTNLFKLANELENSMKLDASNNKLSITEAYNSYNESYSKSNEFALSHGVELTKPSDYLDILISTKTGQYVEKTMFNISNTFLDEEGKAITPEVITNQVMNQISKELGTLSNEDLFTEDKIANIKSMVGQAYNQKMGELVQDVNNSKKSLLGEISNSESLYDVDNLESYFKSNYPTFIVDTVGKDLLDVANYKNDQLIIQSWNNDKSDLSEITQADLEKIKTPEIKSEVSINIATSKLNKLLEPGKANLNNDSDIYKLLGIELSNEDRKIFEKQIVEKLTPGEYKTSTLNPITTAIFKKNDEINTPNNILNNQANDKTYNSKYQTMNNNVKQRLESDRLNPFLTDEELNQNIFKYVQSGILSVEDAEDLSKRPNFIDGISTEISKHIDSIYDKGYLDKSFTEGEKTSILNSLRKGAYEIYINEKPSTAQEWENYYTKVDKLAKKETINTFVSEMNKIEKTLNSNDFVKTFSNQNVSNILNSYQQGDLDFYVNPEQLDSLLFHGSAFDINNSEYSTVDSLEKYILKNYYGDKAFDDLNKLEQISVKSTATIAFATRQERQLVNSYFDTEFIEPKKVGNRFVYKLDNSLYVSLINYNDDKSIKNGKADFLMITPKEDSLSASDFKLNNYTNRLITLDKRFTINGSEAERADILKQINENANKAKINSLDKNIDNPSYDNPATYTTDEDGNKISLKPQTNNNLVMQSNFESELEKTNILNNYEELTKQGKSLQASIRNQLKKINSEREYLLYGRMNLKKNILM